MGGTDHPVMAVRGCWQNGASTRGTTASLTCQLNDRHGHWHTCSKHAGVGGSGECGCGCGWVRNASTHNVQWTHGMHGWDHGGLWGNSSFAPRPTQVQCTDLHLALGYKHRAVGRVNSHAELVAQSCARCFDNCKVEFGLQNGRLPKRNVRKGQWATEVRTRSEERRRRREEEVTYSCSRETSPLNACLSIDWISFLYK